ncbi:hypothetical protein MPDQ_003074 [Monascus purpureus]|uniref:Uncharacterized protein n=1 Tax=Monascus purpureus TaxID=5098 RepID=A0A507QZB3_MONPU|nr:hypothetical protein MPDQ_003074 [Monascus purpureus]BDD54643.1 hypothetical protein MAP00_000244 [Monascus purpureus]
MSTNNTNATYTWNWQTRDDDYDSDSTNEFLPNYRHNESDDGDDDDDDDENNGLPTYRALFPETIMEPQPVWTPSSPCALRSSPYIVNINDRLRHGRRDDGLVPAPVQVPAPASAQTPTQARAETLAPAADTDPVPVPSIVSRERQQLEVDPEYARQAENGRNEHKRKNLTFAALCLLIYAVVILGVVVGVVVVTGN